MYGLKIADTNQVSFGPVPVLMVVKIIWSTSFVLLVYAIKAYPGSEFVVANTLAKWKKFVDFSQGFSQKVVSSSCSVFNSLPSSGDIYHLLITFANSLDTDQAQHKVGPDLDPYCLTP